MVNDVQVAAMLEKRRRLQGKALSCISTSQHNLTLNVRCSKSSSCKQEKINASGEMLLEAERSWRIHSRGRIWLYALLRIASS
jgi:hypothetical protein